MCLNKVYVRDVVKSGGNYFNCGRCPACRQASANRRAKRIVHHKQTGSLCYFVTLTYDNEHIPYFRRSELAAISNHLVSHPDEPQQLNLYHLDKVVDKKWISSTLNDLELSSFSGLYKDKRLYDSDKISFAYTPIVQKFFKRLRHHIGKAYPERNIRLSYFYAPEYGPTTQRLHSHCCIWAPAFIGFPEMQSYIVKAWPFAADFKTREGVELAKSPARYVASYVNCSSDVSPTLLKLFPLRPTHSLYLGFGEDLFSLSNVLKTYQETRNFKYIAACSLPNGQIQERALYFPKYLFYRYFPKCKGFSRLSRNSLLGLYLNPKQHFTQSETVAYYSRTGRPYYASNIILSNGDILYFAKNESYYFVNRLYNCFDTYWKPLGVNWVEFVYTVIDIYTAYYSALYRDSLEGCSPRQVLQSYFNIDKFRDNLPQDLQNIVDSFTYVEYDCNKFDAEIELTQCYNEYYNKNIKTRKINQLACY